MATLEGLDPVQLEALREVMNLGSGKAAAALSQMVGQEINIGVPKVSLMEFSSVPEALGGANLSALDNHIVTEETDLARTGSREVWFVDPLDGTVNFAHSYPFFCASVAFAIDGEIVAGAVFDPLRDELFSSEKGSGAHLNGRRLKVTTASRLIESLVITGFPYDLHEKLDERLRPFNRVMGLARAVRRDGAAALDLWLRINVLGRCCGGWLPPVRHPSPRGGPGT